MDARRGSGENSSLTLEEYNTARSGFQKPVMGQSGPDRSRIAGMMKVLARLKLLLYAWLRQPKDEMDRRQDRSEIQALFPPKK